MLSRVELVWANTVLADVKLTVKTNIANHRDKKQQHFFLDFFTSPFELWIFPLELSIIVSILLNYITILFNLVIFTIEDFYKVNILCSYCVKKQFYLNAIYVF